MEFRLLRADEVEARVSTVSEKGCSILLYKDARADMNILDETVGISGWQRRHELINGNLFCSVGIYVDEINQWIWKQDVGVESYTEKEKGQASDAFKRACFNLGIGRELYTSPFIWFSAGECTIDSKNGKYTTRDRFEVVGIEYDGRKIKSVDVKNTKTGKVKTFGEPTISKKEADEISDLVCDSEFGTRSVLMHYGVRDFAELTKEQAKELREKLNG